jgi:hypothetical protein
MGLLLGYLLGRRRERPEAEWAYELDAHADELRSLIDELRQELSVLDRAVAAGRLVVPVLRPADEREQRLVADFVESLQEAEEELAGDAP